MTTERDNLTDKQKVLAVWPGARCDFFGHGYYVYNQVLLPQTTISKLCETELEAWADAARLVEQQKTKQ